MVDTVDDVGVELILVPVVAPGQQKAREVEIRQHRAYHRTLWRPSPRRPGCCCRYHAPSDPFHDRYCQPAHDDAEEPSIDDAADQHRISRPCGIVVK